MEPQPAGAPWAAAPEPGVTSGAAGPSSHATASLPFGVLIVALAQAALAAWVITGAAGLHERTGGNLAAEVLASSQALNTAFAVIASLQIVFAAGLLLRWRWAWVGVMLTVGVGLVYLIAARLTGGGDDVFLALEVLSAFYLNQRAVRAVYGYGSPRPRAGAVRAAAADE